MYVIRVISFKKKLEHSYVFREQKYINIFLMYGILLKSKLNKMYVNTAFIMEENI